MKPNANGNQPKRPNYWKMGFIILVAAQLAFFGVIASRLIEVREPVTETVKTESDSSAIKVGNLSTNKEELNQTLSSYLKGLGTKNFTFKFYASNSSMLFEGKYTFFGYEVPLYVYFEPYVSDRGAIQLKVTSFSAGTLPLPEGEVLKYIAKSYDLPEFVTVDSKESLITIDVTKIKNDQNIYLKADKIDLTNDLISFTIYKKNEK